MINIVRQPSDASEAPRGINVTDETLSIVRDIAAVTNGNTQKVAPYPKEKKQLDSLQFAEQPALPGALAGIAEEPFPAYERPVKLHLESQGGNADRFFESGAISKTVRDMVKAFARIHDYGYRLDDQDDDFNFPNQRECYVSEFTNIGTDLLQMEPDDARKKAEKLYDFLLNNKQNRMIYRVMGHAAKSVPYMIDAIEKNLMNQKEPPESTQAKKFARGLAYLFFVHHAGRPITTVMDVWCKGMVPEEFREMLGVDIGELATEPEKDSGLPKEEIMRLRAIRFAVDKCGFNEQEAKDTVAVVYASDRLSAGNAQEFYAKKGRLVVGNILGNKDDKTWTYDNYAEQVEKQLVDEPAAAKQASIAVGASPEITDFIDYQASDPNGVPKTRAKVLKDALAFANGRLKELADIFSVNYSFAGHFSQLDADLHCVEEIQRAAERDDPKYYHTNDMRVKDMRHLKDLHDMLVCIRSGLRPIKIDLESYAPGSPERRLAEAVSNCPPGRRRTILNGILEQATAALKTGSSILEVKVFTAGSVVLTKNEPNDTVYAVLGDGMEVLNPDTNEPLDLMDPPNVLGEISAGIDGGRATATCRVRPGYTVTALAMKREHFLQLLNDEHFADDYGSLSFQRLMEQRE